jgi:hypothetical protein
VDDRIRKKLANLISLAQRPGTAYEGEAARLAAIRLSQKYGIECEFTASGTTKHASTRPTASAPSQSSSQDSPVSDDAIFYKWIKALASLGWGIHECLDTKIGRQIKFRKPGFNSELRVTQRAKNGQDFEAEHIKNPDPGPDGKDRSFAVFMTISLKELLRHISYTNDVSWSRANH